jgi:chaperonin GroEL
MDGAFLAARLAGVTLGPNGARVVLDRQFDFPEVTKDGFTAIRDLEFADRYETLGAEMIKACAKQTRDAVGDGSTTASVLAGALCREGVRLLGAGYSAIVLRRRFESFTEMVREALHRQSVRVTEQALLERVASVAAAGDDELAGVIAHAVERLGPDGVINVSFSQSVETTVDFMPGMKFDHGLLSRHFLTDPKTSAVKLDQPYLLMCEDKLERAEQVVPALEAAKRDGRALLVLAQDVTDQALAVMLTNHRADTVKCAAVKGPGSGIYRHAQTSDIAVLTGGRMCGEGLGILPERAGQAELGACKRAVVEPDFTTIFGGAGDAVALKERVAQIRDELAQEKKTYDRGKLETRLARLVSGVANIRVGAYTETAWKERQKRAENALNTARAAAAEGVVAGGGVALARAAAALTASADARDPVAAAYARVLETPLRQIVAQSGGEPSLVLERLLREPVGIGYDGAQDTLCDFMAAGIIDATKVVATALDHANSAAGQLIMADCVVALDKAPNGGAPQAP